MATDSLSVLIVGSFDALKALLIGRGYSVKSHPALRADWRKHVGKVDLLFLDEEIWSQDRTRFAEFKVVVFFTEVTEEADQALFKRVLDEGAKFCISKSSEGDLLSTDVDKVLRRVGLVTKPVRLLIVRDTRKRAGFVEWLKRRAYTVQFASFEKADAAIEKFEPHVVITDRTAGKKYSGVTWAVELVKRYKGITQFVVLVPGQLKYISNLEYLKLVLKGDERELETLDEKITESLNDLKLDIALDIKLSSSLRWADVTSLVRLGSSRTVEPGLTDIIRKLFFNLSRVTITSILKSEGNTGALFVSHDRQGGTKEYFIVRFGPQESIKNEKTGYFGKGSLLQPSIVPLVPEVRTMWLGGLKFSFSHRFAGIPRDFASFYENADDEQVCSSVKRFIEQTCANWYGSRDVLPSAGTKIQSYLKSVQREISGLETLKREIEELVDGEEFLGMRFTRTGDRIEVKIGPRLEVNAPDPLEFIKNLNPRNMFTVWATTNSCLNSRNVFVDSDIYLFPTEFHKTSKSPILHDFSCLETMVKFELLYPSDFADLFQFENILLKPKTFSQMDSSDLESTKFVKEWRVIQTVRHLASKKCHQPEMCELFFCLLVRTLKVLGNGLIPRDSSDKVVYEIRKRYALLSAAMLAKRLEELSSFEAEECFEPSTPIRLDNESREGMLVGDVIRIVSEAGHIYREVLKHDWGIDGEIEFKNEHGQASGRRVYLQLKSGDSYLYKRKRDGKEIFKIQNSRHLSYWQSHAYPVLLVIRAHGQTRFMNVTEYLKVGGANVTQVEFQGEAFNPEAIQRLSVKFLSNQNP